MTIIILGGVATCLKRKFSLEEAFSEADTAYEKPKKVKKDEVFDSDHKAYTDEKKKSKYHQVEEKLPLDKKSKGSETSDKERDDQKKKIDKLKLTKSEHCSETGASSLSSLEQYNKHNAKKDRKHEKKKKKSTKKSKKTKQDVVSKTVGVANSLNNFFLRKNFNISILEN